jgi:lipoyl(octanoyl) transferase
MGVRASRWVTMHGWAFNVNTDLQYFDYIVPCGIKGKGVTSLHSELGHAVDENEVKQKVAAHFIQAFGMELKPMALQNMLQPENWLPFQA